MAGKHFYFPFYTKEFISGTLHMSAEEIGAYVLLMCFQYENGSVPVEDRETIERIARTKNLKKVVVKFPKGVNKKLQEVKDEGVRISEVRAKAIQNHYKRPTKRLQNAYKKPDSNINSNSDLNINSNSDLNTNININKEHTGNAASAAAPLTPQAAFVSKWEGLYEKTTGSPYKRDNKDFVIAADLLKKYSAPVVLKKSRLLFNSCKGDGSLWFAKSMGDFTISKLSNKWNEIIPGAKKKDKTQETIDAADEWERKMEGATNAAV